jgi:hypothetical protein
MKYVYVIFRFAAFIYSSRFGGIFFFSPILLLNPVSVLSLEWNATRQSQADR